MKQIDIETIDFISAVRKKINTTPLREIEFLKDGKVVEISSQAIEEFLFMGLNNIDFITSGEYLRGAKK